MPIVLATDVLVWLLVAAAATFAWYCARRPHLAAPWARVFRSRAAVASGVFLAAYLVVGLLDSLHFRPALPSNDPKAAATYSVQVRSVLDVALTSLRERSERTYSAPLATRLFQKEQLDQGDGKSVRDYPRLRHGGAHLKDESQFSRDVA